VTGYTSDLGRSIVDVSVDESLSFISRNYCSHIIRANAQRLSHLTGASAPTSS